MVIRGMIKVTQYMTRKKFYVPKNEIRRNYNKEYDRKPTDYIFECDFNDESETEQV